MPPPPPIAAASLADLRGAIAANPANIPLEVRARENKEREHWIADRLSVILAERGDLSFPLSRELDNNPDCRLVSAGETIGLEISELVPYWLRRAQELNEILGTGARIDNAQFNWADENRWTDQLVTTYLQSGGTRDPHHYRGYAGDHGPGVLAAANARVTEKTDKLNAVDNGIPRYQHFAKNWLGLYVSHASPSPEFFRGKLVPPNQCPGAVKFDQVFLLLTDSALVSWPPFTIQRL